MTVLRSQRQEGVLTLDRLDRYDAFSAELVEDLLATVDEAEPGTADVLVVCGAGPGFGAGFDLGDADAAPDGEGELLRRFVRIEQSLRAVDHAPFVTLALAHGVAADLVCACTHRVAAPGTRFRMPGLRFGVVLGTRRLARRVGADAALAIHSGGRVLDAEEALRLGLLTAVVPQDGWDATVARITAEVAGAERSRAQRSTVAPSPRTTGTRTWPISCARRLRRASPPVSPPTARP
ncbi:enoyl-CoA hydratase/isomerase family protein [Pseudonocardia sp.]|uniref:enoyl-CoA hydratase/isomerase family protein n=1 Tax=Pseudonocardia sp. TaxID=60912 RepID=UPI003D0E09FF